MKISYNWLKEYIQLDLNPEAAEELLTGCGLEVEGIEKYQSVKGGLEGVVIGEVLTCEKHPGADRLSKTTVKVAEDKVLPIVCGAPNVAAGQKVAVATVGTTLYADDEAFKIKKSKIRGEASEGMICAEDELGLGHGHDGIMVLDADAVVGTPAGKYFDIQEDFVFEIGLTPNRADATSHIGTARDLVAVQNFLAQEMKYSLKMPEFKTPVAKNNDLDIKLEVENSELCPRYCGITMTNIEVKDSPDWLKARLEAVGIRSINNIVDITNYVMMETGQPMHAFDAAEIKGNKVVVKTLPQDTKFVTLDDEERKLNARDLMICNAEEGMCIAGVFGGAHSGVKETTNAIFLESAYFNPTSVRKTARRFGLNTDSSFRFERGADVNMAPKALARAVELIEELAGGVVSSEMQDFYPNAIPDFDVEISFANVNRLIGKEISPADVRIILESLNITINEETEEGMKLTVPSFKVDVTREADIIEEIIRVYGFNNIELKLDVNACLTDSPKPDHDKIQNTVSDMLVSMGFNEIMNNSLTSSTYTEQLEGFNPDNNVKMLNPLSSELNVMRQSLLFGIMETVNYNQNRQITDIMAFEFGKTYAFFNEKEDDNELTSYQEDFVLALSMTGRREPESWNTSNEANDFFRLKGTVLRVLQRMNINIEKLKVSEDVSSKFKEGLVLKFKKETIAELGAVSGKVLKHFDIKQDVYYAEINWKLIAEITSRQTISAQPISKFPEVRRDLALLVDKSIEFGEIKRIAFEMERNILKSVDMFDVYEGEKLGNDKKSYAVKFILQDTNKTLTDKVIDKTMNKLIKAYQDKLNAELR
ncbi:MAG: phenylalanine--tRNA ligase subunit beta [Hyphomicrobiales bacterium]